MNFIRIYVRVLALLAPEARLAWLLAFANVALAVAQFADPLLFGRLIDALVGSQAKGALPSWADLAPLLATWVAVGLFSVLGGVLVALHADRLAHRRRNAVLTDYFEHILELPLAYHGATHSGRLMKVMLTGTDPRTSSGSVRFENPGAVITISYMLGGTLLKRNTPVASAVTVCLYPDTGLLNSAWAPGTSICEGSRTVPTTVPPLIDCADRNEGNARIEIRTSDFMTDSLRRRGSNPISKSQTRI